MQTNAITDLATNSDFLQADIGWAGSQVATQTVPATAGAKGSGNALRIAVKIATDSYPWNHTMRQKLIGGAIKSGDTLYFRAFLRSPESLDIGVYVEGTTTYEKQLGKTVKLSPEWQEFRILGRALRDFAPGEATVVLHCGTGNGVIEMTGVHVENHGALPQVSLK